AQRRSGVLERFTLDAAENVYHLLDNPTALVATRPAEDILDTVTRLKATTDDLRGQAGVEPADLVRLSRRERGMGGALICIKRVGMAEELFAKAEADSREALRQKPGDPVLRGELVLALSSASRLALGETRFDEALELFRESSRLCSGLPFDLA